MKNFDEQIEVFFQKLEKKNMVLFGYLSCRRLISNYHFFQKRNLWGKYDFLVNAIFNIRDFLTTNDFNIKHIEDFMQKIEETAPDSEDYPEVFSSFAIDATSCIFETYNIIICKNPLESILNISTSSIDTVDIYIQELENLTDEENLEDIINNNILMIEEKRRQIEITKKLISFDNFSNKNLNTIELFNETFDKPNLMMIIK